MGVGFTTFLKWAVCLTPLLFSMDRNPSFNVGVMALFTSMVLVIGSFNKAQREINIQPLFGVLAASCVSFLLCKMNTVSLGAIFLMISFMVCVWIIASNVDKDFDIYVPLSISCSIGMVSAALESLGWSFFNQTSEFGGLLGNAPQLCLMLCILIAFVVYRGNGGLAIALAVTCLALGEITGIVTWFISRILYLWKEKWKVYSLIACGVFLSIILFREIWQAVSIRLPIWSETLLQIAARPLFGYGPGIFDSQSGQFITGQWHAENAFSSWLQFMYCCGALGIASVIYAIRKYILTNGMFAEKAVIIVLLTLAFFEYPSEVSKLWPLYAVIIGVFMAKQKEIKQC